MLTFKIAAKHIFLYGIGILCMKGISLIMLPIVTRILPVSEYGKLEVLLMFINLTTILLNLGQDQAIFCFGGLAKKPEEVDKICVNSTLQVFFASLLVGGLLICFSKSLAFFLPGNVTTAELIFLCLAIIFSNPLGIQLAALRLKDDAAFFVKINLVRAIVFAGLTLLLLYLGYGVTGVMFASAASALTFFCYFLRKQLKNIAQFNLSLQKKLFLFGLPLSFNGVAEFTIMWLDNWWLAYVVGTAKMAVFALALKLAGITLIIIQPISTWWHPNRFKNLEKQEDRELSVRIAEAAVVFGFLAAFLVALAASLVVLWLIPSSYHKSIAYLPGLCFMFALKSAGDMMDTSLYLNNTSYIMHTNNIAAILAIIGFYFLIPKWEAWGVILVLNAVLALRWLTYLYLSQRVLFLPYHYKKLLFFMVVLILSMGSLSVLSTAADFIFKGGILWIFVTIFAFYFKLLPSILNKGII